MSYPVPPNPPAIQRRVLSSNSTLEFWWGPPANSNNDEIANYILRCDPMPNSTSGFSTVVGPNNYYAKIENLRNREIYRFEIAAYSQLSEQVSDYVPFYFAQPGVAPAGPLSIQVSTLNHNLSTAFIDWTFAAQAANEAPNQYFVLTIVPSTISTNYSTKTVGLYPNMSSIMVPDLTSSMIYNFIIQSVNNANYSFPNVSTLCYVGPNRAFSPSSIVSFGLWLDASLSTNLTYRNITSTVDTISGSLIDTWLNQTGSSGTLRNTQAQYSPIHGYDSVLQRPGLYFGTNNSGLRSDNLIAPFSTTTNYSVFAVFRQASDPLHQFSQHIFKTGPVSTASLVLDYGNVVANLNNITTNYQQIFNRDTNLRLYSFIAGPASFISFLNGTARTANGSNPNPQPFSGNPNPPNMTSQNVSIGCDYASDATAPGNTWKGWIYEILVYRFAMTITDRQLIEGYLANKWGITSTLPANHPYKNRPPIISDPQGTVAEPATQLVFSNIGDQTITVNWSGASGGEAYNFYLNNTLITPNVDNSLTTKTITYSGALLSANNIYDILIQPLGGRGFTTIVFSPLSVTTGVTIKNWYDASDIYNNGGSGMFVGLDITVLNDRSGNVQNASKNTSQTIVTSQIAGAGANNGQVNLRNDGYWYIEYNGAALSFTETTWMHGMFSSAESTMFFVFSAAKAANGYGSTGIITPIAGFSTGATAGLSINGENITPRAGSATPTGLDGRFSRKNFDTMILVCTRTFNSLNNFTFRVFMNGAPTEVLSYTVNGLENNAINRLGFDGISVSEGYGGANSKTREILFFQGVVQSSDRIKMEGYLAWKWGLQSYNLINLFNATNYFILDNDTTDRGSSPQSTSINNISADNYAGRKCYIFNGTQQSYISIPFANSSAFTISAWFNMQNTNSFPLRTSARTNGTLSDPLEQGLAVQFTNNVVTVYYDDPHFGTTVLATATYSGNEQFQTWHHYAFTVNNATGTVKIYYDGSLLGTGSVNAALVNTNNMIVGQSCSGYASYLAIHSSELSQQQITNLYHVTQNTLPQSHAHFSAPPNTSGYVTTAQFALTATSVLHNSISISWSPIVGATSYIFRLNGTTVTPSIVNITARTPTATFNDTNGITASTLYSIQVTAVIGAIGSQISATLSVTSGVNPPTAITSLSRTILSPTSFRASWLGGNNATSYLYTLNGATVIPAGDNGVLSKSADFTNLIASSRYNLVVTAINSGGRVDSGTFTNPMSVITDGSIQNWYDANDSLNGTSVPIGTTITQIRDKSGYNNNAAAQSLYSLTTLDSDPCLYYNGKASHTSLWSGGSSYTVNYWIYALSLGTVGLSVGDNLNGSGNPGLQPYLESNGIFRGYLSFINGDINLGNEFPSNTDIYFPQSLTGQTLSTRVWQNITISCNNGTNCTKLFLNGNLLTCRYGGGGVIAARLRYLFLARLANSTSNQLKGYLRRVAVYNTALSDEEIMRAYTSSLTTNIISSLNTRIALVPNPISYLYLTSDFTDRGSNPQTVNRVIPSANGTMTFETIQGRKGAAFTTTDNQRDSSTYLNFPFTPTGACTFSLWYLYANNSYGVQIFTINENANGAGANWVFKFSISGNTMNCAILHTSSSLNLSYDMSDVIKSSWIHFGIRVVPNGLCSVHINGTQRASGTSSGTLNVLYRNFVVIGKTSDGPLNGTIRNFALYNSALTDAQMTNLPELTGFNPTEISALPSLIYSESSVTTEVNNARRTFTGPITYLELATNTIDTGSDPKTVSLYSGSVSYDVIAGVQCAYFNNTHIGLDNANLAGNVYTYSYWVYLGAPFASGDVFTLTSQQSGNDTQAAFRVELNANEIKYVIRTTGGEISTTNALNILPTNSKSKWMHLAFILDSVNGLVYSYIDGCLKEMVTNNNFINANRQYIQIGRSNDRYFGAYISRFAVYNYRLTSEQISSLAFAGSGLVHNYPLLTNTNLFNVGFYTNQTGVANTWDYRGDGAYNTSGVRTIYIQELFKGGNYFTISFWFKPTLASNYQFPFAINSDDIDGTTEWMTLRVFDGNQVRLFMAINNGSVQQTESHGMNNLVWNHLCVTFAENKVYNLWINGSLRESKLYNGLSDNFAVVSTRNKWLYIGRGKDGGYIGGMRDFRVYNRVLNSSEIYNLSQVVYPYPIPASYFPLSSNYSDLGMFNRTLTSFVSDIILTTNSNRTPSLPTLNNGLIYGKTSWMYGNIFHIFVVVAPPTSNTSNGFIIGRNDNTNGVYLQFLVNSQNTFRVAVNGSSYDASYNPGGKLPLLISFAYRPNYTLRINGVELVNNLSSGTLSMVPNVLGDGPNNSLSPIKFNELIMIRGSLTDTQVQNIEGYLAWKWNLQRITPLLSPVRYFRLYDSSLTDLGSSPASPASITRSGGTTGVTFHTLQCYSFNSGSIFTYPSGITDSFTITGWFVPPFDTYFFLNVYPDTNYTSGQERITVYVVNNALAFRVNNSTTISCTIANNSVWNHLAFTYNSSNLALQIYINGELSQTGTAASAITSANSVRMNGTNNFYMRNIGIYTSVLTAENLLNIAASESANLPLSHPYFNSPPGTSLLVNM